MKRGDLFTIKKGKKQSNYIQLKNIELLEFRSDNGYLCTFKIIEGSAVQHDRLHSYGYSVCDYKKYNKGNLIQINKKVVQPIISEYSIW